MEAVEEESKEMQRSKERTHDEIRKAKREMWVQWVEEGKSVWDIARVARNPFNLKTRCTKVEDEEGRVHSEDKDIGAAFIKHNIMEAREDEGEEEEIAQAPRRTPREAAMRRVRRALSKTKNKSAAGPDGISWRLLKMIKGTALGQAVLEDVQRPLQGHRKKTNSFGKHGGETRGEVDSVRCARNRGTLARESVRRKERKRSNRLSHAHGPPEGNSQHGRDLHSTFNAVDTNIMCDLIMEEDLRRLVRNLLAPRSF